MRETRSTHERVCTRLRAGQVRLIPYSMLFISYDGPSGRHLYAMYCLLRRELVANQDGSAKLDTGERPEEGITKMPKIFTDPGWETLNTSIISTSNCGNPALRLFGFGPVAADGYGIGYIIKEDRLSLCIALTLSSMLFFLAAIAHG